DSWSPRYERAVKNVRRRVVLVSTQKGSWKGRLPGLCTFPLRARQKAQQQERPQDRAQSRADQGPDFAAVEHLAFEGQSGDEERQREADTAQAARAEQGLPVHSGR